MMKNVLMLRSDNNSKNAPILIEFAKKVQDNLGESFVIEDGSFDSLLFDVSVDKVAITDPSRGFSIDDFDLVIVCQLKDSYRHMAKALTAYCKHKNIKFFDEFSLNTATDKLSKAMALAIDNISTPRTLYGPIDALAKSMLSLGKEAIFKDVYGTKGKLNFLVKSPEEILKIQNEHPEATFVLQEYIPNDGYDYRIEVVNGEVIFIIKRSANDDTHLTNISAGGSGELIKVVDMPKEFLTTAIKAAKATRLGISGVDLMYNTKTKKPVVIEMNLTPQIITMPFPEENIKAYSNAIKKALTF